MAETSNRAGEKGTIVQIIHIQDLVTVVTVKVKKGIKYEKNINWR